MMKSFIVYAALFLIYFHIGGFATTNIIRLTAGNSLSVLSSRCECDSCGCKIPPLLQLPIISFIICRGKCKNCGAQIPLFPLVLEFTVITGMFVISAVFKLTFTGITASFVYYEAIRVAAVLFKGKRSSGFAKNYITAVVSMLPVYALTMFVALLYSVL